MTEAVLVAWVGFGSTALGAIIGFAGTAFLGWLQGRNSEAEAKTKLLEEVLTSAVICSTAIALARANIKTADLNALLARLEHATSRLVTVNMWKGRKSLPLRKAAFSLSEALGQLVAAMGAKDDVFAIAQKEYGSAIAEYRAALDAR